MRTKHDIFIDKLITETEIYLDKAQKKICEDLTFELRSKYKGKVVKCKCFDAWEDGDDYYLNQELLDICAQYDGEGKYFVCVTFLYKSPCAAGKDNPKNTSFLLESIEEVT